MSNTRQDQRRSNLIYGLFLVFMLVFCVEWRREYMQCDARGGALVRGSLWFQCVERR